MLNLIPELTTIANIKIFQVYNYYWVVRHEKQV